MQKYIMNVLNFMYAKKFIAQFLFIIFFCFVIHLWFLQYFYYFADDFNIIMSIAKRKNMVNQYPKNSKFILVWNRYDNILKRFGIKSGLLNCSSSDCVLTDDKNLLYDYKLYDGIIFNEYILNSVVRPNRRSKFQFYIFSTLKSSNEVPACDPYYDNFFNLTFTYKLESNVLWSYIVVRNHSGAMIAPKASINWEKSLSPLSKEIKSILTQKTKTAVWLANHYKRDKPYVEYITRLQEHLFRYSLKIDIYGQLPLLKCPGNCQETIRDKYYFYLALEDSFAEDHVTDLVLNAYNNFAVPVIFGGANYSRFLPPDSYIDARKIHPYNLAYLMNKIIKDPDFYEDYFRWTLLYTIKDNSKSYTSLCSLCDIMNRYKGNTVVKEQFRRWWNGLNGMKRCLSQDYWNERANLNANRIFNVK